MELNFTSLQFSFSLLFSIIFVTHGKLFLDPSDFKAFIFVQRDLGIDDHHPSFTTTPCNSPAVTCERRVANYSSILKITRIAYHSEQLGGFISPQIGRLSELRELSLANNHLVDLIPDEIVNCRKLEVLNLHNNHFTGRVPTNLSKLVRLRVLDFSTNRITGDLSFLRYFPNLETLSLANNLFTGKIPVALRSFKNLQFFDISGNDYIHGSSPALNGVEYISSELSRKSLVTRRYILEQNSSRTNHSSNATHRATSGPAQAPSPSAQKHKRRHKRKKLAAWLLGFLAGGVVGAICGMIFSVFVKMGLAMLRGREKGSAIAIFSPLIKKEEDIAFLAKDDALANLPVIGKGGCGEVYKAELPGSNGKIIAIKKIIQPPKEAVELTQEDSKMLNRKMRQIRSEIKTVGRIRHRNLLPLLAHVPRAECHLLMYEYMKNGSLQDIMEQAAEGKVELDWLTRQKIALGVASGLEYLHFENNPRVIHRDLKPGNILLDDDMEPRIADFGLAKEMPVEDTHMSTLNVVGTLGYIAPEYHQTVKFTDKCDIYSLGVVLGALVMGRLPNDQFFQEQDHIGLVKWLRNTMTSEEPKIALDTKLMGNGYDEQMLQVLKIACFCTLEDPKQRPDSKNVRAMLSQINNSP